MLVLAQVDFSLEILITGRWPIEVADTYRNARVIGIDLSPIQPTRVPRNCEFRVADLREELEEFHDGSMDLIQSRSTFLEFLF